VQHNEVPRRFAPDVVVVVVWAELAGAPVEIRGADAGEHRKAIPDEPGDESAREVSEADRPAAFEELEIRIGRDPEARIVDALGVCLCPELVRSGTSGVAQQSSSNQVGSKTCRLKV
jgi:hypothetical protein